jgi:hypothetical protein
VLFFRSAPTLSLFFAAMDESTDLKIPLMMEAVRTSETSVDNYFTRQYIPEDNSEQIPFVFVQYISQEPG